MTTMLPNNTARLAWTVMLEEGQLGMLPEHRQRRRLNAARRLARYHVARKAREMGMLADEWQERTIEGREDASLAVRVSARLTANDIATVPTVEFGRAYLEGDDLAAFQDRLNTIIAERDHADGLSIPARFLAGQTSAEAFRAWEAPRRAAYEAAREAAIARLEPAFEQLGRMIDDIANPPRYITTDEEHTITADQLAELRPTTWVPLIEPGRIWTASTAGPQLDREPVGWWHYNVNAGRVHDHPERPGASWSVASHRLCQQVATIPSAETTAPIPRPSDIERRHLAARYLAAIGQPQDGHVILGLEQVFTAHNLDHVRQWMTDAYPAMRDPSTPTRCTCGDLDWPADLTGERFIAAAGWAHRLNSPCHRMIRDEPQA